MKALISKTVLVLGMALAAPAMAGDAEAGKELSVPCAACHNADGNSLAPNFPKLAAQGEKYLLKQMKEIKSGVRSIPEMAGQLDALSDTDLENLATYFAVQPGTLAGAKDDAELLALGQKIYMFGNASAGVPACSGCHSPTGQGNAPASFPRLSGQHADYIAKQLRDFRAGAEYADKGRHNDGDSRIMRTAVERISDREIEAVANYISGLN